MTFPTDWDIEKYRVNYECEDHWELRRRFLETHKGKFPEERLVCLAQAFCNVEFMGCRYPEKTMRLVAELSIGVADLHRERMKTKLQHTFVQASEAARCSENEDVILSKETPMKFLKFPEENDNNSINNILLNPIIKSPQNPITGNKDQNRPIRRKKKWSIKEKKRLKRERRMRKELQKMKTFGNSTMAVANDLTMETTQDNDTLSIRHEEKTIRIEPPPSNESKNKFNVLVIETTAASENIPDETVIDGQHQRSNPLSDFVLLESGNSSPFEIVFMSAKRGHKDLKLLLDKSSDVLKVTLQLEGHTLAKVTGSNLKHTKSECYFEALKMLRKSCYTIKSKKDFAGPVVDRITESISKISDLPSKETLSNLAEESKANRMMKLMGWSGGGLGKTQQGCKEPVKVEQRLRRVGLGAASTLGKKNKNSANGSKPDAAAIHKFRMCMNEILRKFSKSDATHDLIFSSKYSKLERYQIHCMANRLKLKSKSYGLGENRQLVLSIDKSPQQILSDVLKAGGSTAKYDAVPPECF